MLKRTKNKIYKMVDDLCRDYLNAHEQKLHPTLVFKTCETCGCLIDPKKAVEGICFVKSIKKQQLSPVYPQSQWVEDKEIYTPYYCLIHAPIKTPIKAYEDKKSECNCKIKPIEELYYELIIEVLNKYPGESRHETALRYIREKENISRFGGNCATKSTHHETGREEDV